MIHLAPPYLVIGGYTVLPDHADPGLFYVLPAAPRLARTPDDRPAFALVQFLGGGAGTRRLSGGLLTLTTELTLPDETLDALRPRVQQRLGGDAPGTIRLQPVPFDGGTVELIALGAASGSGDAGGQGGDTHGTGGGTSAPSGSASATPGPFNVRFLGVSKPSLAGANTATFQLLLDEAGAELLEKTLDAPELPVIAVYRLTFVGLRPSFGVKVEADWRKVYRSIQHRAKSNVYFVAAEAESLITHALEESDIRIETNVFGVDGQGAAERARKQLVDWVLQNLFTPMTDARSATANAIGQVIDDTVWSLARTVLPGVSYRVRTLDEEQVRFLSARMDEAVAERREVVPQGTVGAFLQGDRTDAHGQPHPGWPALRDALVQKVNLDGFPRVEVQVAVEDRFATDGLATVRVDLARPGDGDTAPDARSFAFRAATERQAYLVNLLGEAPARLSQPYRYRVAVDFDPTGPFGPHETSTTPWRAGNAAELVAEPRRAYAVREVEVGAAPTFSFAPFPAVTVELAYDAEGDAARQVGRLRLTAAAPAAVWRFRSFTATPLPYRYRVTYHRPGDGGGDIEGAWGEQIDGWLAVADPLPAKRTLNLFVGLPWPEITLAYVQLRYHDDAHDIHYDEQIALDAATPYLRRDYPIAAAGPRTLAYRLTILPTSGVLMEGSWRQTEDDRLVLDRRLVERRALAVRAVGGTLAENRLRDVRVQLEVREPGSGTVRAETDLSLASVPGGQPPPPWEYTLGDPPVRTVFYRALFVDRDGFTTRTPWQSTDGDLLVVQLRTKTLTA